ncbi:MAG: cation-transporting P-type ATPase, partial [Bacteroidales bacterium]|nr:cation-transporting P-type ATPase [Bacteroidales bacterium]
MKKNYTGLTDEQAERSRLEHGINIMTPPKKKSIWLKLLEKFTDPLIIILLIAGALSIGISFYEYFGLQEDASVFFEPIGIFVAVFLSTGLAFYFENRAEGEFELLNKVNDHEKVKVYRNGNLTELDKSLVVVGDILVLSSGDEICADATLCEAVELRV